jgi:hypothetical protein
MPVIDLHAPPPTEPPNCRWQLGTTPLRSKDSGGITALKAIQVCLYSWQSLYIRIFQSSKEQSLAGSKLAIDCDRYDTILALINSRPWPGNVNMAKLWMLPRNQSVGTSEQRGPRNSLIGLLTSLCDLRQFDQALDRKRRHLASTA